MTPSARPSSRAIPPEGQQKGGCDTRSYDHFHTCLATSTNLNGEKPISFCPSIRNASGPSLDGELSRDIQQSLQSVVERRTLCPGTGPSTWTCPAAHASWCRSSAVVARSSISPAKPAPHIAALSMCFPSSPGSQSCRYCLPAQCHNVHRARVPNNAERPVALSSNSDLGQQSDVHDVGLF